ncbi:DUF397 domain-containing protein [Streptomyces solicavernae]|uniref:DUF397 domain-containing protein n=1 Tax=Streptomyces solicavernae TaxID=3043614 RepID=UPI0032B7B3EF
MKSTYSSAGGECVEVATNIPDTVAIRDSKAPDGHILRFSPSAWRSFAAYAQGTPARRP